MTCCDPVSFAIKEPFLPVRTEMHPKRNQARQKLATLSENRFKDLASDVLFEIERRFGDALGGSVQPEEKPAMKLARVRKSDFG
jgi:hypothetical protein